MLDKEHLYGLGKLEKRVKTKQTPDKAAQARRKEDLKRKREEKAAHRLALLRELITNIRKPDISIFSVNGTSFSTAQGKRKEAPLPAEPSPTHHSALSRQSPDPLSTMGKVLRPDPSRSTTPPNTGPTGIGSEDVDMESLATAYADILNHKEPDSVESNNTFNGELDDYHWDDDGGEHRDPWEVPDDDGTVLNGLTSALNDLLQELNLDAEASLHSRMGDLLKSLVFPDEERDFVVQAETPLDDSPSSPQDDDEPHPSDDFFDLVMPTAFHIKISLFVSNSRLSRTFYEGMVPLLNQVLPPSERLPLSLRGLHSWRRYLPETTIVGTTIKVDASGRQSGGPTTENPEDTLFTTKATSLIKALAANPIMQEVMYFGMQHLVDDDKIQELHHTPAWGESVTVTSGSFAFYESTENLSVPIFPGDLKHYTNPEVDMDGDLLLSETKSLGLITQVCQDYRRGHSGEHVVRIQRVVRLGDVPKLLLDPRYGVGLSEYLQQQSEETPLQSFEKQLARLESQSEELGIGPFDAEDLVLWEDPCEELYVPVSSLESGIPMTPIFTDGIKFVFDSENEAQSVPDPIGRPANRPRVFIPLILNTFRVVTLKRSGTRDVLRAEAEIAARGYNTIISKFIEQKSGSVLSVPLVCFADAFGLYTMGNGVYRSMMAIYLCLACLPLFYRMSIKHQYPLAIGPMGVRFGTILVVLEEELKKLADGVEIMFMGEKRVMVSTNIALLGDMLQQNTNAGIRGPKAVVCCRSCTAGRTDRSNITFNTCEHARTLWQQMRLRNAIAAGTDKDLQQAAYAAAGLSEAPSLWQCIVKEFDPFRMTPHEPCHILGSCLAGLYQSESFHPRHQP